MEDELEDEQTNAELVLDKSRKAQMQVCYHSYIEQIKLWTIAKKIIIFIIIIY